MEGGCLPSRTHKKMPLDRTAANIFVGFGSVFIKKSFCPILIAKFEDPEGSNKTINAPNSRARFLVVLLFELAKNAKNYKKVGCSSV